jgi:hypothetical protein
VQIEKELRKDIRSIFEQKKQELGVDATLDLKFLNFTPIENEPIYGEAFPEEKRINIEVFAPDATKKDLTKTICEELLHIKYPQMLEHTQRFWGMVGACMKRRPIKKETKKRI